MILTVKYALSLQARLILSRDNDRYRHIERTRPTSQVTRSHMLWFCRVFAMLSSCFQKPVLNTSFVKQDGGTSFGKTKETS
jgi:hypothetical protein